MGRVREIFENAIDLQNLEERESYVNGECGSDASLLSQVNHLLAAHDAGGSLLGGDDLTEALVRDNGGTADSDHEDLETPTLDMPAQAVIARGTFIGSYKLLQQIGEGGMGTVWMAEQEKPVRRRVAVKLIRGDMGNPDTIARFEAERQALAMMDHQNIARVFDAGTTNAGSPWFAMELVKGIPITKYCDQNKLGIRERLELIVPVCRAIQHAHHKGVVHRDIKPSNVLVTLYDGRPVPKIIDFGLAKALEHQVRLTDKTLFTEFGKVVGTLQYMSPEQAELNALDVDTRTDIYSLGVLIYELLTGSTPIDKSTVKEKAILQVLALIRETEPPRPSTRLSESKETLLGISKQRKIAPPKLQEILRGELDWIVMRALEKDRTRRYGNANSLADDVERYLTGDAVLARPPSTGYRLKKFVGKNRGLVTALSAIAGVLIVGMITSGWFALIANSRAIDNKKLAEQKTSLANENIAIAEKEKGLRIREAQLSKEIKTQAEIATEQKCKSYLDMGIYLFDEGRQDEGCDLICKASAELPETHRWRNSYLKILESRATRQGMWTKPTLEHSGSVYQAMYTEGDEFLVTRGIIGSEGGRPRIGCRVWNPSTGTTLGDILDTTSNCTAFVEDPSSDTLLLVLENGNIERWNYRMLERVEVIRKIDLKFFDAKLSPDCETLALVCRDEEWAPGLVVLNIKSKKGLRLNFEYPYFSDFMFTPDSAEVLLGFDSQITAVNVSDGKRKTICQGRLDSDFGGTGGQYTRLDCSAGRILAGINSGYQLDVWSLEENGELIGSVSSKAQLTTVKFSPNGDLLALGAQNGIVQLFEPGTLRKVGELVAFSPVTAVKFFPDGRWLAVQTSNNLIRFFDLQLGKEMLHPVGHDELSGFSISKAGNQITTYSDELTLARIWDLESTVRGIRPFKESIVSDVVNQWNVVVSVDRQYYALTKHEEGHLFVKVKRTVDEEVVVDWKMATEELNYDIWPVFSPNQSRLLYVIADELVIVDFSDKTTVGRIKFESPCEDMGFSPDGKVLVVELESGVSIAEIDDLESIKIRPIKGAASLGSKAAFSKDSRELAYLDENGKVAIYEFETKKNKELILPDEVYEEEIGSFEYHPSDSNTLVLAFPRELTKVSLNEITKIVSTKRFPWEIKDYSFSSDGKSLAIAYVDETIEVFDGETFEKTNQANVDVYIQSVLFWPDKNTLVVNESNGGMVLDVSTMKTIGKLCESETLCFGSSISLTSGHAFADYTTRSKGDLSHGSNSNADMDQLILNADGVPYFVSPDRFRNHVSLIDSKDFTARFQQQAKNLSFAKGFEASLAKDSRADKQQFHQNLGYRSRYRSNSERTIQGGQLLTVSIGLKPDWGSAKHHLEIANEGAANSDLIDSLLLQTKYGLGEFEQGFEQLLTSFSDDGETEEWTKNLTFALAFLNKSLWPKVSSDPKLAVNKREVKRLTTHLNELLTFGEEKKAKLKPATIRAIIHTLGVAEYRLANFQDAIELLTMKTDKLSGVLEPGYSAFLAMSHLQLGNTKKANEYRQLFDQAMKLGKFKDDEENQSFAIEVEAAFKDKSKPKQPNEKTEAEK